MITFLFTAAVLVVLTLALAGVFYGSRTVINYLQTRVFNQKTIAKVETAATTAATDVTKVLDPNQK